MRIFFKGEKIGAWEVIDPKRYYRKSKTGKYYPMILCYSSVMNELKYVLTSTLISGTSKGIGCKFNGGHSTRGFNKELPKYVYLFPNDKSKKKYRVCKKIKGTNDVKTLGYFKNLEKAKSFAKTVDKIFN